MQHVLFRSCHEAATIPGIFKLLTNSLRCISYLACPTPMMSLKRRVLIFLFSIEDGKLNRPDNVRTGAHSCNNCCRTKAKLITYSECVSVALTMQHVSRISCIVFSTVACLCVKYLLHYHINDTNFDKSCVSVFSTAVI